MKPHLLLLAAILTLSPCAEALSDKGKEASKKLQMALREEARKPDPTERGEMKADMLARIQVLLANPESEQNIQETLGQLSAYFTSEDVISAIATLQTEIRLQQELEDKVATDAIQNALIQAGKAVEGAKVPADLDKAINELGKLHRRGHDGRVSAAMVTATNQIESTLQFVTQWQNYLSALATNNWEAAKSALQNLSSNTAGIVPRSDILKRLAELQNPKKDPQVSAYTWEAAETLAAGKSVTDIEETIDAIQKLRSGDTRLGAVNQFISALLPMNKAYQDFKAGLTPSIDWANNRSALDYGAAIASRYTAELLLIIIPRYVGAPEGTHANPGESPVQLLNRLSIAERDKGNIPGALRGREALRMLDHMTSNNGIDSSAINTFIVAQNQYDAEQFMLAVVSYQNALKAGSDFVPAKLIGERLKTIQTNDPAEYAAGLERFLNPQMPNRGEGYPARPDRPNAPALPTPKGTN